jgi:DNA-binding transcriptional LysR family regulator
VELTELEAEDSLPLLARGGVDVAIAEEYEHAPRPHLAELHRDELEADELVLTLPRDHPLADGRDALPLAALRGETWACARADTNYADMFVRVCRIAGGFEPVIHHRVNDIGMLIDLVAVGGVAALLPSLGQPDEDPRVAVRPVAEGPFTRALFVATRTADRGRPSTAAVVEAIGGRGNRRKSLPAQAL